MEKKEITSAERTFLSLVRASLEGRPAELPGPIPEKEWPELMALAQRQSVIGLLYKSLEFCPEESRPGEADFFRLVAYGDRVLRQSGKNRKAAESLLESLRGAGLHPILLKGPAVAGFYPDPDLREYGDIDIYLPPGEFSLAPQKLGTEASKAPDGSLHYVWEGVDVDQHQKCYDLHVPKRKLPSPNEPEGLLLMVSSHAMKHALGTGIGLRQCIDMAMAYRSLGPKTDGERLRSLYRLSGTLKWNRMLSAFIRDYLGVEPVFDAEGASGKPLLEMVFKGGNFGHFASGRNEVLSGSTFRRKADTARRFVRHLPFSLSVSPKETLYTISDLIKGNSV